MDKFDFMLNLKSAKGHVYRRPSLHMLHKTSTGEVILMDRHTTWFSKAYCCQIDSYQASPSLRLAGFTVNREETDSCIEENTVSEEQTKGLVNDPSWSERW